MIEKISEEQKQKIIAALKERGATLPCPRCGNQAFTLLDGYFNQTIQTKLSGMVIGGPSVPSVVVGCDRCGLLSQHALGTLGLLPAKGEKE